MDFCAKITRLVLAGGEHIHRRGEKRRGEGHSGWCPGNGGFLEARAVCLGGHALLEGYWTTRRSSLPVLKIQTLSPSFQSRGIRTDAMSAPSLGHGPRQALHSYC